MSWIDLATGKVYEGDCRIGDRAATDAEIAADKAAKAAAVPAVTIDDILSALSPAQQAAIAARAASRRKA